jgi:tetratricopeptide (TPR) repeat protein
MSPESLQNPKHRVRAVLLRSLPLLAVAGFIAWLVVHGMRPSEDDLVRKARLALSQERCAEARDLAERALELSPDSTVALLVAGDAERASENLAAAVDYYERIQSQEAAEWGPARWHAGETLLRLGRATAAEKQFRRLLSAQPDHLQANLQMTKLLAAECRRREAVPFVLELFRQGRVDVDLLSLLSLDDGGVLDLKLLHRCRDADPSDARVLTGLACAARSAHDADGAIRLLHRAIELEPDFIEGRAKLGRALWETMRETEFAAWLSQQGPEADNHPLIWTLRGLWEQRQDRRRTAIRCFWEALRRDPNDQIANYRLAKLLETIGRKKQAAPFLKRSVALARLIQLRDALLNTEQTSLEPIRRVVVQLESLGRLWEAWGWCRVALRIAPSAGWFADAAGRLRSQLSNETILTPATFNPAEQIDLSEFSRPSHTLQKPVPATAATAAKDAQERTAISFRDDAAAAGLAFRYFNSPSRPGAGQKMYEFNGGGCAVLDYDGDGLPDLYFTNGCRWPVRENRFDHLDRLYRNVGDGTFRDVTQQAGLAENRFSLGVTVGDFDNDGFPDLYAANIGPNRLYRNNGDGTFSDVTGTAGVGDPRWSTSCLMADLDGDGHPEIYSVNYLEGADVFHRVCAHADGTPRMCMPFHFPGSQDQLYQNLGDGRFENVTSKSDITVPNGRGLGIVAADWTGDGRLSLFVANDTVANFFFINRTKAGGRLRFSEQAVLSGVALNRNGQAEGCMGIAAGDAFGDGRLSLYVTNFYQETNTLYRCTGGPTFEDVTRSAGLAGPSLPMLGFGTQFLDADLDGHLDLILTNGHIDDYRKYGRPYRMRAQFHRNRGDGRFEELFASKLGPFFAGKRLGRGLARVDWNRDGREDAVISHLDGPVALLTNTTGNAGNFLALRLRGVACSRDAIGTSVQVRLGKRTLVRQLTAGDGYQASNERRLVFGLGAASRIDTVAVRWPSGRVQQFAPSAVNREFIAIEGRQQLHELPNGFHRAIP